MSVREAIADEVEAAIIAQARQEMRPCTAPHCRCVTPCETMTWEPDRKAVDEVVDELLKSIGVDPNNPPDTLEELLAIAKALDPGVL